MEEWRGQRTTRVMREKAGPGPGMGTDGKAGASLQNQRLPMRGTQKAGICRECEDQSRAAAR